MFSVCVFHLFRTGSGQEVKSHGHTVPEWVTKTLLARYLKNYPTNFNQTRPAHTTVNAHCVTAAWIQKIKVQVTRGLAVVSFLTILGRVAFLVGRYYCVVRKLQPTVATYL